MVRDLLPAYLEGLTEEETSTQVRAHLEDCENCRELEKDMRAPGAAGEGAKGDAEVSETGEADQAAGRRAVSGGGPVVYVVAL